MRKYKAETMKELQICDFIYIYIYIYRKIDSEIMLKRDMDFSELIMK